MLSRYIGKAFIRRYWSFFKLLDYDLIKEKYFNVNIDVSIYVNFINSKYQRHEFVSSKQ